jgi:hypothetical protein
VWQEKQQDQWILIGLYVIAPPILDVPISKLANIQLDRYQTISPTWFGHMWLYSSGISTCMFRNYHIRQLTPPPVDECAPNLIRGCPGIISFHITTWIRQFEGLWQEKHQDQWILMSINAINGLWLLLPLTKWFAFFAKQS